MTNYVDLDDLRNRVFFVSATMDKRFIWRQIYAVRDVENELLLANPDLTPAQTEELGRIGIRFSPTSDPQWADGFQRFMIVDCAHQEMDRDGALCTHCGHAFPYETPGKETP